MSSRSCALSTLSSAPLTLLFDEIEPCDSGGRPSGDAEAVLFRREGGDGNCEVMGEVDREGEGDKWEPILNAGREGLCPLSPRGYRVSLLPLTGCS